MSVILVTGINGFVGKHLARELSSRNIKVVGVGHREKEAQPEIADLLNSYYKCDVTNEEEVKKLPLAKVDSVINLAGLANVGASFDKAELYMEVNVKVLSVLSKELFTANPKARMLAISSGALYDPRQQMPLNENSKTINDGSPYALSKLAMEKTAEKLRSEGYDCIIARPFNHIGPGQGQGFLIADLATKLMIASPNAPVITAGNLKTVRDYTDVRDITRAYADLATSENLNNTLYNVCSGQGHSGEEIVKSLCDKLRVDFNKLTIKTDPSLIRPSDPPRIVGDNSRLNQDVGWQPSIELNKTIEDIVTELKA